MSTHDSALRPLLVAALVTLTFSGAHANMSDLVTIEVSHEITIAGIEDFPDLVFWIYPVDDSGIAQRVNEGETIVVRHSHGTSIRWDFRSRPPVIEPPPVVHIAQRPEPRLRKQRQSQIPRSMRAVRRPSMLRGCWPNTMPHLWATKAADAPPGDRIAISQIDPICVAHGSMTLFSRNVTPVARAFRLVTTFRITHVKGGIIHMDLESEQVLNWQREPIEKEWRRTPRWYGSVGPADISALGLVGLILLGWRRRKMAVASSGP
ncbi:hypothetical protein JXA47_12485 [Candidatus Sumerlaeota bacterium]|nr:hypothetical protein [Candidatus Sumerlaeota bacterium]